VLYSQTTKYCVMVLAALALRQTDQGVRIRDLARDTCIPAPFLGQLIPVLVKSGLLTSKRGRNGGLQFARPAGEIHLAEVVRITEGDVFFEDCLLTLEPCDGSGGCSLHNVWGPLRDHIVSFLEMTTIEDVARADVAGPQCTTETAPRPARAGRAQGQGSEGRRRT
jgi:Rrf2 family transcriptional regulator, iron-sulfur cluster assembly transcription factor